MGDGRWEMGDGGGGGFEGKIIPRSCCKGDMLMVKEFSRRYYKLGSIKRSDQRVV